MTATMVRRSGRLAIHDRRPESDPAAELRNGRDSDAGRALIAEFGDVVDLPDQLPAGMSDLERSAFLASLDLCELLP